MPPRMMYDTGEEFWGDNPPFRAPVFVLTHRPRPALVKEGGTTFTFVTDGIHSALDQAKAAAGDRNVDIAGGASTVQQYLREGLIDELQLHVVPELLGEGLRLFEGVGAGRQNLEIVDGPVSGAVAGGHRQVVRPGARRAGQNRVSVDGW